MKFITGSDLLTVPSIDVTFIKYENEFSRRPIAHTCSPSLELPSTYNNFCELREEFTNILRPNKLGAWPPTFLHSQKKKEKQRTKKKELQSRNY